MSHYKSILLAIDFTDQSNIVGSKAKELADNNQAQLNVIHIVDNLPVTDVDFEALIPFEDELINQLMEYANNRFSKICDELNIPEENRMFEVGSPKKEIIRIAEEKNIDLIVVGSHGRHGLSLLLGSTANSVIHHAKCDVLAVRIMDD